MDMAFRKEGRPQVEAPKKKSSWAPDRLEKHREAMAKNMAERRAAQEAGASMLERLRGLSNKDLLAELSLYGVASMGAIVLKDSKFATWMHGSAAAVESLYRHLPDKVNTVRYKAPTWGGEIPRHVKVIKINCDFSMEIRRADNFNDEWKRYAVLMETQERGLGSLCAVADADGHVYVSGNGLEFWTPGLLTCLDERYETYWRVPKPAAANDDDMVSADELPVLGKCLSKPWRISRNPTPHFKLSANASLPRWAG